RILEQQVIGAGQIGRRAESQRTDDPELVIPFVILEPRAPGRDPVLGSFAAGPRSHQPLAILRPGAGGERRFRLLEDSPGEAPPGLRRAAGEDDEYGELHDAWRAELSRTGVE